MIVVRIIVGKLFKNLQKKDSRIIALRNAKNLTVCRTANRALDMVRGEFIARLDSDDVALPERFSQQLDFLEKNLNIFCAAPIFNLLIKMGKLEKFDNYLKQMRKFRTHF